MIKALLLEYAQIQNEITIDEAFESLSINDKFLVISMRFLKEHWTSEGQAREWAKDKCLSWLGNWFEDDAAYILTRYNEAQFNNTVEIEIRPGVWALVGEFNEESALFSFSDKSEFSFELNLNNTQNISADVPEIIQVAKVIKGYHPSYGELELTNEHLVTFVENFNKKVFGIDLAINEDHKREAAFGWFREVFFIGDDEENLFAAISWNSKGIQALANKEYRYISPEFHYNWKHPHSGIFHGPTLLGAALTNYPFLKMEALNELNNKGDNVEKIDLKEHQSVVSDLNEKITGLETNLLTLETSNKELSEKVKTLEAEKVTNEKNAKHEKLFKDGKINAAQMKALNEGKELYEVLDLNTHMNTSAQGSGAEADVKVLSNEEKEFAKKFGLSEDQVL